MSKFNIGDKVVFSTPPNAGIGTVIGFDVDGYPHIQWPVGSSYFFDDWQLLSYEPDYWSDFQERIKNRFF